MTPYVVMMMTAGSAEEAAAIGKALVEERLVACCNIVPRIRSIYRWRGEVCDDAEALLIAKTRSELASEVIRRVRELHSYETPEAIALPIEAGLDAYLSWIDESTGDAEAHGA